jgi:exodeoxyribonuclease V alpha subunit
MLNNKGQLINFDPRKDLDLAYAVTTHKAQGSEYDTVVYVLNKSIYFIQDRNNFYTAITRARRLVHVITDQRSLSASVQPPKELRR